MGAARQIVRFLYEDVKATPIMLASKLTAEKVLTAKSETAPKIVRNMLVVLLDLGLVKVEPRGVYSLTTAGKRFFDTEIRRLEAQDMVPDPT